MRKVLSLFALLLTAVTAMATGYTGQLTYTLFGSTDHEVPEAENVIVESTGDNLYQVTLKGCDFSEELGYADYNFGNLVFSNLTGTTENGVTTITATNPESKFTAIPLMKCTSGDLTVRFNADKAYVNFDGRLYMGYGSSDYSFWVSFGTDDFPAGGGESGGGESGGGETPTNVKLVEDGYAPNGETFITPFTVNWNTHKLVATVDLTGCKDEPNECIFSVSTNQTDIANWEQESGSTLHLFYTKNAKVWTASGWETYTKKFAVQYRTVGDNGAVNHYKVVDDPSNVVIEMSKEGLSMDGELVFPASEMTNLYGDGDNALYFGSVRAEHTYCTYKSVELVETGSTPEPEQPTVEATYEYTSNAMTQYLPDGADNAQDAYMKDAKVELVKYSDNTYAATFKDVVVGDDNTLMGDVTFKGLVYHEAEDDANAGYGYEGTEVEVNGKTYSSQMFTMEVAEAGETPATDKLFVQFYLQNATDGSLMAYQFGDEVFIPVSQEFTNEAHVTTGDATTDLAEAKVVLTEFMEDVYRVTFKNLTLGDKTGDFTIDNLEASVDGNNVTFTTDETYGTWNDADETESTMSDFSLTATKEEGVEGLSNLVLKFTAEGSNVVFGEALPTPPVENPTKEYTDKLTYTVVSGGSTIQGVNAEQQLTVEQVGENLYTLKLAKLNSYNTLYLEMGEITFANVAGTTEDGVTTIDVESPAVEMTDATYGLADAQNGHLVVTLTDDKATLEYTGTLTAYSNSYPYGLYFGVEPVVDGISNVEATGVDANAEIFTVSGAKAGNLQRGLNIVRNANGKVVKVLVK